MFACITRLIISAWGIISGGSNCSYSTTPPTTSRRIHPHPPPCPTALPCSALPCHRLLTGNRNRAVRHTEVNMNSSRSHAILQIVVEQWPDGGAAGTVVRSKLNFVDLAGSERWNKQADMHGARVNELTAINSSLSALATVVAALTEGSKHIPYRDSKLTHLLQVS